jgi:histidinol-phosphate aminotransferase
MLLTRRDLHTKVAMLAAGLTMGGEAAYAQRRLMKGVDLSKLVLLNANENPEGPPQVSIDAMARILAQTGRYHDEVMERLTAAIAESEDVKPNQVVVGCGSSEILHCAVSAFTSPTRPLIAALPSYELPVDLAQAYGHGLIRTPLAQDWGYDVRRMVGAAEQAKGGLIYIVNPNNPTSSITKKADIAWLVDNLPPNTVALIDEAYIHFSSDPELASALPYIRAGKNVVVTKTFSKIYGMAGLRVGYSVTTPELSAKLAAFRNGSISVTGAYAALAALASPALVPQRRERFIKVREDFCQWLGANGYGFIRPYANFVMIQTRRNVWQITPALLERGIAVGRPFPPLDKMVRVTIGSEGEMQKFEEAFLSVTKA